MSNLASRAVIVAGCGWVCVSLLLSALVAGDNWVGFVQVAPWVAAILALPFMLMGYALYLRAMGRPIERVYHSNGSPDELFSGGRSNSYGEFVSSGGVDSHGRTGFE